MSTPNSSDGGGGMLPFRVSTDFNLGLFLKNEKSALKLDRTASGRLKSWPSSASSTCNRFAQVDDYVTREYWSLDIEYLCSCLCTIFWSLTALYLLKELLPYPCFDANRPMLTAAAIIATINILEQIVIIAMLIYAKYSANWHVKIMLLNASIGLKLALVGVNFCSAVVYFLGKPCGTWYADHLHYYDDDANSFWNNNNGEGSNASFSSSSSSWSTSAAHAKGIVDGFRYYDIKIMGVGQIFASVAQCVAAMLLLVKRNDIKMYVLWRLSKLDQYIDDIHSHM